ncbi:hypothetical protein AACH06_00835 [Ideonella sp. DXS29W]|uniref:Uncharacterized protein n=1 Tax=Ideonella lacteola TaxID=2984193 RepID=A0ABU9BHC9_9BURK
MTYAVTQNPTNYNMVDMQLNQGSTVTQGSPMTAQFAPGNGQAILQNFIAQTLLSALQMAQPQAMQGAGQMLSMVGRLLNELGKAMQGQSGYQQPVCGQNPQASQAMQMLQQLFGGNSTPAPQWPPYGNGGGVQQPQTYLPVNGGSYQGNPSGPMDESRATKVLSNHFSQLSGGDKTFNKKDLEKAAADPSKPELQRAAQFALDNPMFMRGLDTAGKGDRPDGKISARDLRSSMQTGKLAQGDQAVLDTISRYAEPLYNQSGRKTLNRGDFERMANGGNMPNGQPTPPDMQEAARAMLSKPALFERLDSAKSNGRSADGGISKRDVEITQSRASSAGSAGSSSGTQWPQNRPQIIAGEPGYGTQFVAYAGIEARLQATGQIDLAMQFQALRPQVSVSARF